MTMTKFCDSVKESPRRLSKKNSRFFATIFFGVLDELRPGCYGVRTDNGPIAVGLLPKRGLAPSHEKPVVAMCLSPFC